MCLGSAQIVIKRRGSFYTTDVLPAGSAVGLNVTADAFGRFKSRWTVACSNSRDHTYGDTKVRGPSGAPSERVRSGYHSGGAGHEVGSSGHATIPVVDGYQYLR
jgi:hypothetical protein